MTFRLYYIFGYVKGEKMNIQKQAVENQYIQKGKKNLVIQVSALELQFYSFLQLHYSFGQVLSTPVSAVGMYTLGHGYGNK